MEAPAGPYDQPREADRVRHPARPHPRQPDPHPVAGRGVPAVVHHPLTPRSRCPSTTPTRWPRPSHGPPRLPAVPGERPRRIAAFPTTPAEIPDEATTVELLDAYYWHLWPSPAGAAASRRGRSAAGHAVAALARQALVDALVIERWPLVRDGLVGGATVTRWGPRSAGWRSTRWPPGSLRGPTGRTGLAR